MMFIDQRRVMNRRRTYTRTGVFAWSRAGIEESGLIVAEAAQQIDLSRDTSSSFFDFVSTKDIVSANSALQIKPTHSVPVTFKLNDVVWSSLRSDAHPAGLIVGGGESGMVCVLDAASLVRGEELKYVGETRYHQGHILSVDVSPVNPKWVCSGGALGSILLWDMNSPLNPMSPGTPNFTHQIKCVRWNHCAEHILGSLTNERCSIWDLRKPGSPVLDIADIGGGVEWSVICWNPIDGTTLCLASQSDTSPIVQKWDLRFASAPVFGYQLHSRGVFGMDWNAYDPNLLATVGRDEQILIQNPNNSQLLGRIVVKGWARRFAWNPTNPNLFAISFFDRPLEIHSLAPFPSNDLQTQASDTMEFELSVIPAWMKSGSCGAHFCYGNKICTFEVQPDPITNTLHPIVLIKKVQEEKELGRKAAELQAALDSNQLSSFCDDRATNTTDAIEKLLWTVLSKQTLNSSRSEFLRLLTLGEREDLQTNNELEDVLKQMDSCNISSEDDSENEQVVAHRSQSIHTIAPISFQQTSLDEKIFLDSLCDGDSRKAIAIAVMKKEWTLALLLAQMNTDENVIRFIANQIDSDASSCSRTRLAALMAGGMWEELLQSWNTADWRRLFLLMLSHAPSHKIRSLCGRLCERMTAEGYALEVGLPAVIAGDVESLMDATTCLPLDQRVAIGAVLRHSLGGGSSRTIAAGPKFQAALEDYAKHLADDGFVETAWKLTEPIDCDNCTEGLVILRHTLYNICGTPSGVRYTAPPADPFAAVRDQYSKLGRPTTAQTAVYGTARPITRQDTRCSGDRRQSVDQHSPGLSYQPTCSAAMPTAASAQSGYWGAYSQPATGAQFSGYAAPMQPQTPNMAPSPPIALQPSPMMMTSPLNGYVRSPSIANGYHPPDVYANQMHNAYISSQSPAPPPPPPAGPYGSLPGGGARIRTMSAASYSSNPLSVAETTMSETGRSSPVASRMSTSSGWNDPPVVAAKKSETHSQVAEIHWKPAVVDEYVGFNSLQTPQKLSSPKPVEAQPQPTYTLSEPDNYLVGTISALIANIRQLNKTPMVTHKMADVEHKVSTELIPRLAKTIFSQQTLSQLYRMAGLMSNGDFHSCQLICADLVKGSDFVELSPIIPALKTLTSTAQQVYRR